MKSAFVAPRSRRTVRQLLEWVSVSKTLGRAWRLVGRHERSTAVRVACSLRLWFLHRVGPLSCGRTPPCFTESHPCSLDFDHERVERSTACLGDGRALSRATVTLWPECTEAITGFCQSCSSRVLVQERRDKMRKRPRKEIL